MLALVLVLVVFAFGRAIANGDYFGQCDHVVHMRCDVVHVLGVVMHRDVPEEEASAPPPAEPPPTSSTSATSTSASATGLPGSPAGEGPLAVRPPQIVYSGDGSAALGGTKR